jgi:cation transporter-like permease
MAAILTTALRRTREAGRRLVDLLGPTGDAARQSLAALLLNSVTSLVAGAALGAITGTLEALPGLLVMVPAAIGLRGNIAGSLGNRISSTHNGVTETYVIDPLGLSTIAQTYDSTGNLSATFAYGLGLAAKHSVHYALEELQRGFHGCAEANQKLITSQGSDSVVLTRLLVGLMQRAG